MVRGGPRDVSPHHYSLEIATRSLHETLSRIMVGTTVRGGFLGGYLGPNTSENIFQASIRSYEARVLTFKFINYRDLYDFFMYISNIKELINK